MWGWLGRQCGGRLPLRRRVCLQQLSTLFFSLLSDTASLQQYTLGIVSMRGTKLPYHIHKREDVGIYFLHTHDHKQSRQANRLIHSYFFHYLEDVRVSGDYLRMIFLDSI